MSKSRFWLASEKPARAILKEQKNSTSWDKILMFLMARSMLREEILRDWREIIEMQLACHTRTSKKLADWGNLSMSEKEITEDSRLESVPWKQRLNKITGELIIFLKLRIWRIKKTLPLNKESAKNNCKLASLEIRSHN